MLGFREIVELLLFAVAVLAFTVGLVDGLRKEARKPTLIRPVSREQEQIARYIDESFQNWD
jgi:hypothetical protein